MFFKWLFILLGALVVFFSSFRIEKNRKWILMVAWGIAAMILGAVLEDPEGSIVYTIDLTQISLVLSLVPVLVMLAQSILWATKKTVLYGKLVRALDSAAKSKQLIRSAADLEEMYRLLHKKQLGKAGYKHK